MVEVKFCGLTLEQDATLAASLGAAYVGVIFAGGPRELTPGRAALVLGAAGRTAARVGVFGADFRTLVPVVADVASLDVIQLHADPTPSDISDVRRIFPGRVWAAVRVAGETVPDRAAALFGVADAVVLDARVPGTLGGSGVPLAWDLIAASVERVRGGGRLVLAGGLSPENVQGAVAILGPDVVDVSSGVESAPGIKDHVRMRAFVRAAQGDLG